MEEETVKYHDSYQNLRVNNQTSTELTPKGPGLRKDLSNRHIQMIALGGAIGTGLFYGSSHAISFAGPSVLIAYIIGGISIFLVVRAMGEMSVYEPSSGAFSYYAYKYWSPRAGFISGWNYWFNYVAVAMAELTVVGTYLNFWFPSLPQWLSAAFVLVAVTCINLLGVKLYGELEFWFAIIKVIAVIIMIILGLCVIIFGIKSASSNVTPSFNHLNDQGGFFPNGFKGTIFSLVVVMFSFGGIELIGITSGEAREPSRTIPKAINQVVYRILIFYVGAMAVIMAIVPWEQINDKSSPFVQIFQTMGIPIAAHILNLVVLTAAISVYNSALYSNGRMLYALSEQGNAPKFLSRIATNGTPIWGVLLSSGITVAAVILMAFLPKQAFSVLIALATAAGIINWVMIMVTHWLFRKKIGSEAVGSLLFKLPGGVVSMVSVIVYLGFIVFLMAFMSDYREAVIGGALWLVGLMCVHWIRGHVHSAKKEVA